MMTLEQLTVYAQREALSAQDALERFKAEYDRDPIQALVHVDISIRQAACFQAHNWVSGWIVDGDSVETITARLQKILLSRARYNHVETSKGSTMLFDVTLTEFIATIIYDITV